MANTFLLKRSNTAANVPTAGELSEGELAINTNAGERRMWSKDAGGTVFEITDHDALTNYVANEHIDWTAASSNLSIDKSDARIYLADTGGTADENHWIIRADADTFRIQTATDAAPTTPVNTAFTINRTGANIDSITYAYTMDLEQSEAIHFEGSNHRITYNDGGGNFNIRNNNYYSAGDKHSSAGKATHLEFSDSTTNTVANLEINCAVSGTADTALSTNGKFYFYNASATNPGFDINDGSLMTNNTVRISNAGLVTANGINMADTDLNRPTLEDYGVKHNSPTVSANAVTIDCTTGNSFTIDMDPATAAVTLTLSNPSPSGTYCEVNLTIIMGTPAYGITWPGSVVWQGGGTAPTLTSTNNVVDVVHLYTVDGGTTWYGTFALAAASGGTGTVTSVATGTGLSGGPITTTGTIDLDFDNLSEKTGNLVAGDRLTGVSGTTHFSETISAIPLSIFSNDSGWTTNTGTVTAVNNGNGMNFTNITTSGTVTLGTPSSISDTSTNSVTASSHTHAVSHTGTGSFAMQTSPSFTTKITSDKVFINEAASATTDVTGDGQVWVKDNAPNDLYYTGDTGIDYPVAYATYRKTSATALDNANQTLDMGTESVADAMVNGCWYSDNATAYTLTLEDSGTTHFPVGAQMTVWNEGSGTLTINEGTGTTLYVMTGTARTDSAGGCTLGTGGYATIIRKSTTVYLIMGAGITP